MQQAVIRDNTMVVTVEGIDAFNEKANEMTADGWDMDYNVAVTPVSSKQALPIQLFSGSIQSQINTAELLLPISKKSVL